MKTLLISLRIFLFFTILTGLIYPLLVTVISLSVFNAKANGSLIIRNNQIIGSSLIGEQFDSDKYFSSRPSAIAYNPVPSGGSNKGLTNKELKQQVYQRRYDFIKKNHLNLNISIPSEMLFASASGLDPHISPMATLLQVDRVAKVRNFNSDQKARLMQCIRDLTEAPKFLPFGEARINVLLLNLEVDNIR